jgi:ligand-binding sensor domain-containing protein
MTRIAVLFVLAAAGAARAGATRVADKAAELRPVEVWRQPQGLPQNTVLAIRQMKDGYLWVGTKGGVTRFDGLRFTSWDDRRKEHLRENEVWAIAEGKGGSVWIATYGGGVSRFDGSGFRAYTTGDGLVNDYVTDLCVDPGGAVWMATDGGVSRLEGETFTRYTTAEGLSHAAQRSVLCEGDGSVWIGASNGRIHRWVDGKIHPADVAAITPGSEVKAFLRSAEGALWIATTDGLVRVQEGRETRFTTVHGLPSNWVLAVQEDRAGVLWVGAEGGLSRFSPETGTFRSYGMDVTQVQTVKAIHADAEGNLWLGGIIDGLVRMRETLFVTYSDKDGLPAPYVTAVLEDSRRDVWLGTAKGLARLHAGELTTYTVPGARASNRITALAEDSAGRVWVGTNEGLHRFESARLVPVPADVLPLMNVRIVLADRGGGLWIGTQYEGVVHYAGGRFTRYTTKEGLVHDAVRALAETPDGAVWIGTKGGLSRFEGGRFTSFGEKEGLAHRSVETLHADGAGALWIATRQGVNRFKQGVFATVTAADGLHAGFVYCFVEDDFGYVWMNSSKGIFRVRKRDLDDFADGKRTPISSVAYGVEHGLTSTVGVISQYPVAQKARDGRVWFCTLRGAAVVDPSHLAVNRVPPAVHIEQVGVDKRTFHTRSVSAPPGAGDLEIRYTGLSYAAPDKVTFKYKLEGYDRDWTLAGSRRVAYYTNIPPGPYRFQVVAANGDRVWNVQGASVDLELAPHLHQTLAFRLGAVGVLALGAVGAHLWRLRALQARERELQRRVQEALADVKTLRGLLPICAACKKVRDDTGYWSQIETYIHERSGAEFSHSICPECMVALYPDFITKEEGVS